MCACFLFDLIIIRHCSVPEGQLSSKIWHSLPHSPLIYYNIIIMSMDCCQYDEASFLQTGVIAVPKTMRSRTAGLKAIFSLVLF